MRPRTIRTKYKAAAAAHGAQNTMRALILDDACRCPQPAVTHDTLRMHDALRMRLLIALRTMMHAGRKHCVLGFGVSRDELEPEAGEHSGLRRRADTASDLVGYGRMPYGSRMP